ncbi:MAG: DMT family transporter [Candidatus Micrarchaeota archaeon]|nr:DMT family transporter [Candidatus Micrarchaeota archaeon]
MKDAKWIFLLLLATIIWGSTFVIVKDNLQTFQAFAQMTMRFGLATLALGAYFLAARVKLKSQDLKRGCLLGIFLFIGYAAQTVGLYTTTATNSAFITGLLVIIVPLLSAFMFGKAPERKIWLAVCLALIGLYMLTGAGGAPTIGDAITLICALAFSFHILYTGKWAATTNPMVLLFAQFAVTTILSLPFVFALGEIPTSYPQDALISIIFLALAASIFAQWAQIKAQAKIDVSRISLILLFEPISAAILGFLLLNETLTLARAAGAGIMLSAMFIAEYDRIKI